MAMDLVRLDDTTRRVSRSIEEWDSLIWTERYNDLGEFQLQSPSIAYHMALMPLGCYVGIRQSEQPMVVENHSIEIDDNGKEILTISGRAMECLMEDRTNLHFIDALGTDGQVVEAITTPNIYLILTSELALQLTLGSPVAGDLISNLEVVAEFPDPAEPGYTISQSKGELYSWINELLKLTNYGIRGIRPKTPDTNFIISLYRGSDLTSSVIFRSMQGHIKVKSYLFSIKGYKNMAYIQSIHGAGPIAAPNIGITPTGIARRDLYVDASDNDTAAGSPLESMLKQRGQSELLKNTKTSLFDFEIMPDIPYVFGTDYFLGDVVRVEADYDLSQDMRVSEFVRTQDEQGYREFPTLVEDIPAEYI